ncbi:MAG: hypothetical protein IPK76_05680 [Lewinellaceae bacterium]|nr:hypothetical protein [Lewinellaceae bacterium]
MTDKNFDSRLKSALEQLEAPYDAASWDILEQRMNAMPGAEPASPLDKIAQNALGKLEAPYQPAHWEMLANRMDSTARVRRRIWITKTAEAAIFLLLLLNLEGLLHHTGTPALPYNSQPAMHRPQADGTLKHKNKKTSELPFAAAEADNSGLNGMPANTQQADFYANSAFEVAENGLPLSPFTDALAPLESTLSPFSTTPEHWASLPDIITLPILLGQPVETTENRSFMRPVAQIKSPRQSRFYATTFANFDRNYISGEAYSNNGNGYGGGIAVGYRAGKWGVEAGIAYNHKRYQPKHVEEIYKGNTLNGYHGIYAHTVNVDILSVPVKATRRVAQIGQATALVTAGATMNVAMDKSYHYRSTYYPGQAPPDPNFAPGQQPKSRQKARGVLEGGAVNTNFYATADLGVRIEHPINRHFAAYIEPAYRHAIGQKGIGPTPAKINTFSVQAGVLATL